MLARILERLFDSDNYPAAVKVIFTAIFFAGAFLVFNSREKVPTPTEEIVRNRNISFKGILWKKILGSGSSYHYQLFIGKKFNWVQTPILRDYYTAPYTSAALRASTNYEEVEKYSLPFYVVAGDSLIKNKGELTVLVKRGTTVRLFTYCQ